MLNIKLYTSQYNTTSKTIETNFKNQNILIPQNQRMGIETRAQKHIMLVKDGPLIQSEQSYTDPISYIINYQFLGLYIDNPGRLLPANQIINIGFSVDETVQYINVQYSIYPEVLTLCNSTLAVLLGLGFFGRYLTQKIIKQELFLLILQNMYKGTFQKILKVNNLQVYQDIIQLEGLSQSFEKQTYQSEEYQEQICVPSFTAKQQQFTLNSQKRIIYNDKLQDEIKENIISETNNESSPKSENIKNSSSFNQEKSILQPKIVFKSKKSQDYQSIKKGIELQNSQRSKLQNNQVQSKMDDLSKKQNLLNGFLSSRMYNQKLSQKIEDTLFSLKLFNKKKDFEKKGLNQIAIQSINSQVSNTLDFMSFYRDILLLKKAIMVFLSNEQLAALELVGFTDMFLEGNIDKIDKKANYFEQQFTISQSEELKCKYIEDFIKKCQQSQNLSCIYYRIFSSLI
ncbi:hypothetical protein ABPG72_009282 [Tetrahymena utriculariae]